MEKGLRIVLIVLRKPFYMARTHKVCGNRFT